MRPEGWRNPYAVVQTAINGITDAIIFERGADAMLEVMREECEEHAYLHKIDCPECRSAFISIPESNDS